MDQKSLDVPVAKKKEYQSKLLSRKDFDERDELDASWSSNFEKLQEMKNNTPDGDLSQVLNKKIFEGKADHLDDMITGLLYGLLTDASQGPSQYFRYLIILQERVNFLMTQLKRIIAEKYPKLLDHCRVQLLWLVNSMIKHNFLEVDQLCMGLLRQIPGSDSNPKSIWLAEQMLQILIDNKDWLYGNNELIPYCLYNYLRILSDHSKHLSLKEREVTFCINLLRDKFDECIVIGRDLIRLLQDLSKIPQFNALWDDMLNKPSSLSPRFESFTQILTMRTHKKFLHSRVTPDIEKQLLFILQQVKMGHQKRYQQWFTSCYLQTPENDPLICDLIRYICGVYHPPNHVLNSDLVQRWVIIGWLLMSIKQTAISQNAKLALFYDWMFYQLPTDNIMNIEPGMLVMVNSIPRYSGLTASLLEFLILNIENYDPTRKDLILKGVHNSLHIMLSKGVVGSIEPLVNCPGLDPQVRQRALKYFAPFLSKQSLPSSLQNPHDPNLLPPPDAKKQKLDDKKLPDTVTFMDIDEEEAKESKAGANHHHDEDHRRNEEAMGGREPPVEKKIIQQSIINGVDVTLFEPFASKLKESLQQEPNPWIDSQKLFASFMHSFVTSMETANGFEKKVILDNASAYLLSVLDEKFIAFPRGSLFISEKHYLAFDLCDQLCFHFYAKSNTSNPSTNFPPRTFDHICELFRQLRTMQPDFGFLLPLFIYAKRLEKDMQMNGGSNGSNDLKRIIKSIDSSFFHSSQKDLQPYIVLHDLEHSKSLPNFLDDCKRFALWDLDTFFLILPSFCNQIKIAHSPSFVHLVFELIDPLQISKVFGSIIKKEFSLIGNDVVNIISILNNSFQWDYYEQNLLWQFIKLELNPNTLTSILSPFFIELDMKDYAALSAVTLLLKDNLRQDIFDKVITLPVSSKILPADLLFSWFSSNPQTTITYFDECLSKLHQSLPPPMSINFLNHVFLWKLLLEKNHKKIPDSVAKAVSSFMDVNYPKDSLSSELNSLRIN